MGEVGNAGSRGVSPAAAGYGRSPVGPANDAFRVAEKKV